MTRIEKWFHERPHRPPAEIACLLARDRFWKNEHVRLVGTHPDWPDAAFLLDLSEELGHALVLGLSRMPVARRRAFADSFYERRQSYPTDLPRDARARLALAASVVLNVLDVADDPPLVEGRTIDLLYGAAQGDDLTQTPGPAVDDLRATIARIHGEIESDDPNDARGAVALALVEVLDPSSGTVDVKEVLARSTFAAVETWEQPRVLAFLLGVADSAYALQER